MRDERECTCPDAPFVGPGHHDRRCPRWRSAAALDRDLLSVRIAEAREADPDWDGEPSMLMHALIHEEEGPHV